MKQSTVVEQSLDAMGELMIWTDVAPENEHDFNQWYDKEHMQERASIPGFRWSRRYYSKTAERPYLALYRTESLHVFHSAPYRQAFENQTEWSIRNFSVMKNTQRRVNAVTELAGTGTGGALSLICLGTLDTAQRALLLSTELEHSVAGVIALRVLNPHPDLSTPLPSESKENRVLEPYLVVEATTLQNADQAGVWVCNKLALADNSHHSFDLLWDLRASDMK